MPCNLQRATRIITFEVDETQNGRVNVYNYELLIGAIVQTKDELFVFKPAGQPSLSSFILAQIMARLEHLNARWIDGFTY